MFGYRGGESAETVARKIDYRTAAQERWSFLTTIDLSSIKNPSQLASMIHVRSSISEEQANKDVGAWALGKSF